MPLIAAPISRLEARSTRGGSFAWLLMCSASADAAMATSTDSSTSGTSYCIGTGRSSAIMPTKCMLQMPTPMATAPLSHQKLRPRPRARATRSVNSRATYDASTAITDEIATSSGS